MQKNRNENLLNVQVKWLKKRKQTCGYYTTSGTSGRTPQIVQKETKENSIIKLTKFT